MRFITKAFYLSYGIMLALFAQSTMSSMSTPRDTVEITQQIVTNGEMIVFQQIVTNGEIVVIDIAIFEVKSVTYITTACVWDEIEVLRVAELHMVLN